MESKSSPINPKSIPPIDSALKDIVGVVSEEIVTGIWSDLKEDSVDEAGGGRVSKGYDEIDILLMMKWSGHLQRNHGKCLWVLSQVISQVVYEFYIPTVLQG